LLRARGALVIDADEIGHSVLAPDGEAFNRVADTWPSVVVDGVIDRRRLADVVFRDQEELQRLEEFTHAAIRRRIGGLIEASNEQVVVVEVPLLTDFMGEGWIRVVVDADAEGRVGRLHRRGMAGDDATRRIAAQPARTQWAASADVVIDNTGDLEALAGQVDSLWARLISQPQFQGD
jgi:dephospho-CoA kinase